MPDASWSRRRFVASSVGAFGAGWVGAHWPAIAHAAQHAHAAVTSGDSAVRAFEHMNPEQVRDVIALAAQIIPTTATAGANEAGVVYFIDRALGSFFTSHADEFLAGLEAFAVGTGGDASRPRRFGDLDAAAQASVVEAAADTPFFGVMRMLTILGFLASPAYGGNRNGVGWQAVGFSDQHTFAPPFGDYDRDYAGFVPYPAADPGEST
ncbi:MAG TPA: gluconate 2-dehydrogenase subunit 3 family protein [Steroidobacteraceae bacterium]|nr:gluconate 2-dehydrogenase subunit 3 family protein [Steroidobacteraceae bacterium]